LARLGVHGEISDREDGQVLEEMTACDGVTALEAVGVDDEAVVQVLDTSAAENFCALAINCDASPWPKARP
jgi:hypothetical protein